MKKILFFLGLFLLMTLGFCIQFTNAEAEFESRGGEVTYFEGAVNEMPVKNLRIEIVAYDIDSSTVYELFKDTFNFVAQGSSVTIHSNIHGNIK